jgi:hypothetical protein
VGGQQAQQRHQRNQHGHLKRQQRGVGFERQHGHHGQQQPGGDRPLQDVGRGRVGRAGRRQPAAVAQPHQQRQQQELHDQQRHLVARRG